MEGYKTEFLRHQGILADKISELVGGHVVWHRLEAQILRTKEPLGENKTEWVASLCPTEDWKSVIVMVNPDDPAFGGIKNKLEGEKISWALTEKA